MDTDNEFDVMDHFTLMLKSCLKITGGSWKDILEADRFQIILLIQDVTFIDKENPVMFNFDCFDCDTNNRTKLLPSHIEAVDIDQDLVDKYFDKDTLSLQVRTIDVGTILYRPSTIGTSELIYSFLKTKKPAYVKKHSALIKVLPRLMETHKGVKPKDMEQKVLDWYTWDDTKISVIEQLCDKLNYTTKETVELSCRNKNCQEDNSVKIDPEGNIKYMFLRRNALENQLA